MLLVGFTVFAAAFLAEASTGEPRFEAPPRLSAAELAPPELLRGEHFRVEDSVPTDGFLAWFTIASDFGTFEAAGPGMLEIRVHEVGALATLEKLEKQELAKDGLRDEIGETREALRRAANQPKETLTALPSGVGRFFKRVGRAGRTAVLEIDEARKQNAAEGGSGAAVAGDAAKAAGRATVDLFGYDDARRELARDLGVDPYTTNPVLSKRLDTVAISGFTGRLGVSIAKSFIPGSMVLSATQTASDWVWDTPPGELQVMIDEKLVALGVPKADVDHLLRHPAYTLSDLALLIASIDRLAGVGGMPEAIDWALGAESHVEGVFVRDSLRMLAAYHEMVAPLTGAVGVGPLAGRSAKGELVAMGPVDYLSWTEPVFEFAMRPEFSAERRSLWLEGQATPRARRELSGRGWTLHEEAFAEALGESKGDEIP
jgi:hypothetical protein